jgi:glucose/arabinose dehydrogenase
MRRTARACLLVCVVALAAAVPAAGTVEPPVGDGTGGVRMKHLGRFDEPVYATTAPGQAGRDLVFVVERGGIVRVLRGPKLLAKPFLDISGSIAERTLEQGLLSIAFDPDYDENRRFYAYFTAAGGDVTVAQFRRSRDRRVRAYSGSERTVITIPHPPRSTSHNGGTLQFGPDGNLWLASGDGDPACDPGENAQDTDSLLGKLLRITPLPDGGYTVPADNPFVGLPGADEVFAYGFRNPYRFSFDDPTGTIAIGDVGQSAWEEIDYATLAAARGANFGWDAYEGYEPFVIPPNCPGETGIPLPEGTTFPVHAYAHHSDDPAEQRGCAVIGGVVARDPRLPTLYGRYLYSDLCSSALRSFVPATDPATAGDDHRTGVHVRQVSSITSGRGHRLYVTSLSGPVLRIEPAATAEPAPWRRPVARLAR